MAATTPSTLDTDTHYAMKPIIVPSSKVAVFHGTKPGVGFLNEDGHVFHDPEGNAAWMGELIRATGGEVIPVKDMCDTLTANHIDITPGGKMDRSVTEDLRWGRAIDSLVCERSNQAKPATASN